MPGTAFSPSAWAGYEEHSLNLAPSASLTDFPLLIDLGALSSSFGSNVRSDGADIRATDESNNELPIDLIEWAYNGGSPTGLLRVKWTGTLATSGTQKVRIWAGNASAVAYDANDASGFGSDDVYDSFTEGYWPLGVDATDRTSKSNDGSPVGSPTIGGASGQIGSATTFNGTSQGIDCGDINALDGASQVSWYGWAKPNSPGIVDNLFSKYDPGGTGGFMLETGLGTNDLLVVVKTTQYAKTGSSVWTNGAWQHFGAVFDGTQGTPLDRGKCYVDGVSQALTMGAGTFPTTLPSSSISAAISMQGGPGQYFPGDIQHVFASSTARSAAWVELEYDLGSSNSGILGTWSWTASPKTIAATGLPSAETFGTLQVDQSIDATGIASAETFGTLRVDQSIDATGIPSAETLGSATLSIEIAATGISSSEALGSLRVDQSIDATGLPSAEAFGSASVTLGSGPQTITATGLPSAEAFGSAVLTIEITATGIASSEALGSLRVDHSIDATGIPSSETFGTIRVDQSIDATGIPSAEAFGSASVTLGSGPQTITATGLPSAEAFGAPVFTIDITATGISSSEALGYLRLDHSIDATGLPSSETFGTASLDGDQVLSASGLPSAEAFGNALFTIDITATGLPSVEAFGSPRVFDTVIIAASGLNESDQFGVAQLDLYVDPIGGLPSSNRFGYPFLTQTPKRRILVLS